MLPVLPLIVHSFLISPQVADYHALGHLGNGTPTAALHPDVKPQFNDGQNQTVSSAYQAGKIMFKL